MVLKGLAFFFLVSILQYPTLGLAQGLPDTPYFESDKYIVWLTRFERVGSEYGEFKFTFTVRERQTRHESTIEMQNLTTQLEGAEVIGDLLVVFGEIRNLADVITILDLQTATVRDTILCYTAKLSATKRYLIYEGFYPRITDPSAASSLII